MEPPPQIHLIHGESSLFNVRHRQRLDALEPPQQQAQQQPKKPQRIVREGEMQRPEETWMEVDDLSDWVTSGRDRFSELPVSVIHRILSFLPTTKDVVATSILSKSLLRAYSSFPITDFSASHCGRKYFVHRRNFFELFVAEQQAQKQAQQQPKKSQRIVREVEMQRPEETWMEVDDLSHWVTSGRDRFSELPASVIHRILSFLPTTKDVVATSILSKSLLRAYSSFPITDFSASDYGWSIENRKKYLVDRRNFFKFVADSLDRQLKEYSCIRSFHLSLSLHSPVLRLYRRIDDLLPLVTHNPHSLDCIHLDFTTFLATGDIPFDYKYLYHVPETFFSNCFACTSLGFGGCSFRALDDSTIRWPSLQVLSIDHSDVADSMIRNLGNICPLLHTLTLSHCTGLRSFILVGLDKLNNLKLVDNNFTNKTIIEIDHAPSLQYLYCRGIRNGGRNHIHLGRCEKLEVLKIKTTRVHRPLLQHILSPAFPALKILVVTCGARQTRVDFSSLCLEKLKIKAPNLNEIDIRAPSLRSFKFINNSDSSFPGLFSMDTTSLSQVVFSFYPSMELFASRFLKMREFLAKFNHPAITLNLLWSHKVTYHIPDNLEDNVTVPSMPCIKNLELKIAHTTERLESPVVKSHEALVDGLLWMCHPESIYLELGCGSNSDCIVAFLEKLRHRYETRDCCSYTRIRCWRHDLEEFEMECLGKNGRRKVLPRSLNSLQCLAPEDKICFRLRWRTM